MPKPVPPPPPQPTVDETRRAVRFVFGVAGSALAFFLLVASSYGPDHPMVEYGRGKAASWNLLKRDQLDEAALRAHPGGKVAWLVGSSILREAFDADDVNADLAARGSEWRVAKFGISRGAAGVIAGFAATLPLREGDLLVHNVTHANLHRDWVDWTALPPDRMQYTMPRAEMWHVQGWTLADKLEQAAAEPFGFWQWHEEVMAGYTRWFEAVWWLKKPKKRKKSFHLSHRSMSDNQKFLDAARANGIFDPIYLRPDCCDYGPDQLNIRGIARLEDLARERDVTLALIHLPPRQEYQAEFVHRDAAAAFDAWRESRADLSYAPQVPEVGFYDFSHYGPLGRARMSDWLVEWLSDGRPRGYPAPLRWPVPEVNQAGVTPPEAAGGGASASPDPTEDE